MVIKCSYVDRVRTLLCAPLNSDLARFVRALLSRAASELADLFRSLAFPH